MARSVSGADTFGHPMNVRDVRSRRRDHLEPHQSGRVKLIRGYGDLQLGVLLRPSPARERETVSSEMGKGRVVSLPRGPVSLSPSFAAQTPTHLSPRCCSGPEHNLAECDNGIAPLAAQAYGWAPPRGDGLGRRQGHSRTRRKQPMPLAAAHSLVLSQS